jgi:hypothetical protein
MQSAESPSKVASAVPLSRMRRKSHECGLAAMEFRLRVSHENIKLRFT